jgi:hypothetical protein
MLVIPALGSMRQEDHEFEAILGYKHSEMPLSKKQKPKQTKNPKLNKQNQINQPTIQKKPKKKKPFKYILLASEV